LYSIVLSYLKYTPDAFNACSFYFIVVSLLPTCQRTYPISVCSLQIADFIPNPKT